MSCKAVQIQRGCQNMRFLVWNLYHKKVEVMLMDEEKDNIKDEMMENNYL